MFSGDVFGDGAEEEEGFLEHQADMLAVLGDRQRADVHAVDQDRSLADVVETADQVDHGALAGTAVSDQGPTRPTISPGSMTMLMSRVTLRVP